MNCQKFNKYIDEYLSGELNASLNKEMEEHSAQCKCCAAELALLEDTLSAFAQEPLFAPEQSIAGDVMAKVRVIAKQNKPQSIFDKIKGLFSHSPMTVPAFVGALALLLAAIFLTGGPVPNKGNNSIVVAAAKPSWLFRQQSNGDLLPILVGEKITLSAQAPETLFLANNKGEIVVVPGTLLEATTEGVKQLGGNARYDLDLQGERFEIKVPQGKVIVWGTSFAVEVQKDRTEIKVFEGRVRFEGANKTVEARVGQKIIATDETVNATSPPEKPSPPLATEAEVDEKEPTSIDEPEDDSDKPETPVDTSDGRQVDVTNTNDLENIFGK